MAVGFLNFSSADEFLTVARFIGESIAKSQFLKCQSVDQGYMIAMTCLIRGVDPVSLVQAYDVIQGRLSKKASAMLAEFRDRGGDHRVLERSADRASIEMTMGNQTSVFSICWDEIKDEKFTKEKDGKTFKDTYATPRGRMQMLWARLISDAVRTMAPEVCAGVYAPEELGELSDDGVEQAAPSQPKLIESKPISPEVMTSQPESTSAKTESSGPKPIGPEQLNEIYALFAVIPVSEASQKKALEKRGVAKLSDLTGEQADEMIAALRLHLPSDASAGMSQSLGAPITAEQVQTIVDLMKLGSQAPGGAAINDAVKSHLDKYGCTLSGLTFDQARTLISALENKQVELFLALALEKKQQT